MEICYEIEKKAQKLSKKDSFPFSLYLMQDTNRYWSGRTQGPEGLLGITPTTNHYSPEYLTSFVSFLGSSFADLEEQQMAYADKFS